VRATTTSGVRSVGEFSISMNRSIRTLRREWHERRASRCPIIGWNSVDNAMIAKGFSVL